MNQPLSLSTKSPEAALHRSEHVDASLSADGSTLTIGVRGDFNFTLHRDFRRAYEDMAVSVSCYVVDFQATTSVDSSMLGMMLLIRDHANREHATLEIRNVLPEVSRQFQLYGLTMPFSVA